MPRKNGNTTVPEQNSYLSHLSGMQVTRKTGESKFDPSTQLNRGKLEVSSARGSDLDTVCYITAVRHYRVSQKLPAKSWYKLLKSTSSFGAEKGCIPSWKALPPASFNRLA